MAGVEQKWLCGSIVVDGRFIQGGVCQVRVLTHTNRLRAALRRIQDEGDAHSNALATAALKGG